MIEELSPWCLAGSRRGFGIGFGVKTVACIGGLAIGFGRGVCLLVPVEGMSSERSMN